MADLRIYSSIRRKADVFVEKHSTKLRRDHRGVGWLRVVGGEKPEKLLQSVAHRAQCAGCILREKSESNSERRRLGRDLYFIAEGDSGAKLAYLPRARLWNFRL
jgi:hypothetical protein